MIIKGQIHTIPKYGSLASLFQWTVLSSPSSTALVDARTKLSISYDQLDKRSNQLARCLLWRIKQLPCLNPDGDRVIAVCMEPSIPLVTALMAIHKIGAAYMPLDVKFPPSRVAYFVQDSKPVLVLERGQPEALRSLQELQKDLFVQFLHMEDLEQEVLNESEDPIPDEELGVLNTDDSISAILYTSGSTGTPKGVRLQQSAILNRLAWQWKSFPYSENEVCCFKTALTFVDSISEIFGTLLTGHKLVVIPKCITLATDELVSVLEREKVGRIVVVPSLLRSILLHCSSPKAPKLYNLRLWTCSGEVFPPDLFGAFFRTFQDGQVICNFYGSTEVLGDTTYMAFKDPGDAKAYVVRGKVPIGHAVDNNTIFLLDDNMMEVDSESMGEIYVGGRNVVQGYVGGAQSEKFISNKFTADYSNGKLFRTGDFGSILNGILYYEGRADSQVKVRGHRVDLSEIETALQNIPEIKKCQVLVYKPGEIKQELVAFYVSDDEELVPETLKVQMAAVLPPYMQPQLVQLDGLPLLINGKVDRQTLLSMFDQRSARTEQPHVDISDVPLELEAVSRALLDTVLKILGPSAPKSISLRDNFFEIGGNSLNVILVITTLKDIGYDLTIGQFLKAKSLKELLPSIKRDKISFTAKNNKMILLDQDLDYKEDLCVKPLSAIHKDTAIRIIRDSFIQKGDLDVWLKPEEWEYEDFLVKLWDPLTEQGLSFALCQPESEEILAVSLNFDLYDEPVIESPTPKVAYIFGFLEACEAPVRHQLPEGVGKVIHSFMMATDMQLSPSENVTLIHIMERENIKLCKQKGYTAMFTTNSSQLTQHVCEDLLSYTVLGDYQINLWIASNGCKPFKDAPDSVHAVTSVKFVNN